ncbi:MAG: endonuclease [Bacilli bacterium]|nr:endonuclease [Bacilli bacterium]
MDSLGSLILSSGGTASYGSAIRIGAKAAAYPNENSSTFIPFYRAPNDENKTTSSSCNREHTWPKSRGGDLFENDPVMVRPTLKSDNSGRENYFYDLGTAENRMFDPASYGYEASRGECARLIFYCVTAYHSLGVSLSNNPKDASNLHTMGTLKTLLKWNKDYEPSEFEKTVNDRYDKMGYRRNPFVDHPEYIDYIYDAEGLITTSDTTWHEQFTDYSSLDGKTLAIISQDPKNAGYFMMGDKAKGVSIPWYISCSKVRYEDGRICSDSDVTYFTFSEKESGKYTITNVSGQRLYGYENGSYRSIGFGTKTSDITAMSSGATNITDLWTITPSSSGVDIVAGSVYLECYDSSFCGYRSAPSLKPMLFA